MFHTVALPAPRDFDIYLLRMREIEAVITSRHGMIVPDPDGTDDVETCLDYARAVAASLSSQDLGQWARRWMPWADPSDLADIAADAGWRKYMMSADQTATLLAVNMDERTRLKLKTIGACDVTKAERKTAAKALRREKDRDRKAEARRAAGRTERTIYEGKSAETIQPWIREGVSRRTWYRRLRGTSVARVERIHTTADTPVPIAADTLASNTQSPERSEERAQRAGLTDPVTGRVSRAPVRNDETAPYRTDDGAVERAA